MSVQVLQSTESRLIQDVGRTLCKRFSQLISMHKYHKIISANQTILMETENVITKSFS